MFHFLAQSLLLTRTLLLSICTISVYSNKTISWWSEWTSEHLTVHVLQHHGEQEVSRGHVWLLLVHHRGELDETYPSGRTLGSCGFLEQHGWHKYHCWYHRNRTVPILMAGLIGNKSSAWCVSEWQLGGVSCWYQLRRLIINALSVNINVSVSQYRI